MLKSKSETWTGEDIWIENFLHEFLCKRWFRSEYLFRLCWGELVQQGVLTSIYLIWRISPHLQVTHS